MMSTIAAAVLFVTSATFTAATGGLRQPGAWIQDQNLRSLKQGCDGDCVQLFDQCAGVRMNSTLSCCDPEAKCAVKDSFYAQCLLDENIASNIEAGWDGRVLGCGEEIPKDLDETPSIVVTDPPTGCKGECALKFDKCGGARLPVSKPCCEEGTACVVKDLYYAQCLTPEDAEKLIGWDGRELTCEEMPADLAKKETNTNTRRLHAYQTEEACEDDTCVDSFGKCGGAGFNTSLACCDPTESCIMKNEWYAQCLTEEEASAHQALGTWDGRVLMCEEMPEDDNKGRRLLDAGEGMYGSYGDQDGGYGSPTARAIFEPPEDCDTCLGIFEQCGGQNTVAACCADGTSCVVKNPFYAQCLTEERAARNIESYDWDGTVLECGEPLPAPPSTRRLLDTGSSEYGYGETENREGGYGFSAPASYGYGACDTCLEKFYQCGGGELQTTACCVEGLDCIQKNDYYAQCLTPERAATNVADEGWAGNVLACGTTLLPQVAPQRRLLDTGLYGYGSYGDEDREGGYGLSTPASYGTGDCDVCVGEFHQCGGGELAFTACCEAGLDCVQKHGYYAQCLTPERAADNVATQGWDGDVLPCGSVLLQETADVPSQ